MGIIIIVCSVSVVSTSVNYAGENMKLFLLPCLLVVCLLVVQEVDAICESARFPPPAFPMCIYNACLAKVAKDEVVQQACEEKKAKGEARCEKWQMCYDNFYYPPGGPHGGKGYYYNNKGMIAVLEDYKHLV